MYFDWSEGFSEDKKSEDDSSSIQMLVFTEESTGYRRSHAIIWYFMSPSSEKVFQRSVYDISVDVRSCQPADVTDPPFGCVELAFTCLLYTSW